MEKIKMTTPLVEMDGDEMTRILWQIIKDELLLPFVELKTEYYDLGLPKREETRDQITIDAANANKKYGVAVKCATITPNKQRVEEYNLTEMWKSPNGTIRAILDGTVFRAPILIDSIRPVVRNWKKPITIARHAYGDVYKCTEYRVPTEGKAELVFTDADGNETFRKTVYDFECPGVLQAPTTRIPPSAPSPIPASSTPSIPSRSCGSPPRTPSPSSTTRPSSSSSRRSTRSATGRSSRSWASATSTPSSTTRSHALSAARVASSGHARTTTATL